MPGTTARRQAGDTASPLVITTLSTNGTTPLTNGVTYTVRLRAVNANGNGAPSASTDGTPSPGLPSAPLNHVVTRGDQQISVAFDPPASDGGSPITIYQYSTDAGTTWRDRQTGDTASPLLITTLSTNGTTALTNGVTYLVRLRAVNANGNGAQTASLPGTPATVPGAPQNLVITPGDQQLSVAFDPPASNGGSAITTYQYSTDGGTTWRNRQTGTDASPLVITTLSTDGATALTNGVTYPVQLRAVNDVGNGPATASTNGTPTAALTAPGNTVAPSISGNWQVGSTLTANPGTWTGNPAPTLSYQWLRCDTDVQDPATCDPIGTDSTSYTAVTDDLTKFLRVRVTGTNGNAPDAEATSAEVGPITAVPVGGGGGGGAPPPSGPPMIQDGLPAGIPGRTPVTQTLPSGGTRSTVVSALVVNTTNAGPEELQTRVALSVPPAAVPGGQRLVVQSVDSIADLARVASLPASQGRLISAVSAQVLDHTDRPISVTFDHPITITATLPRTAVPPGARAANFVMVFWDGSKWVEVQSRSRFLEDGTVEVETDARHFTLYAVKYRALRGFVSPAAFDIRGVGFVVFEPDGSFEELEIATIGERSMGVWVQSAIGNYHLMVINGPAFINTAFRSSFPQGFPGFTPMLVVRDSGRNVASPGD